MPTLEKKPELYFNDPRLSMTLGGRLLVRVVSWITYLVFIAATFTLLISGISRLRVLGVFLGLILIDILIHRNEGDTPISEMGNKEKINVADAFRPVTFAALERGFDSVAIAKRDFFLEMTERLLEFPEINEGLRRLDISLKDFKQKLDEFATEQQDGGAAGVTSAGATTTATNKAPQTKADRLKDAERFAIAGFGQAVATGHNFVEPSDLFSGLQQLGDATIDRLFNLFEIAPGDMERALILSRESLSHGIGHLPALLGGFSFETHRRLPHRIMNRAWTSRPTPTLDQYGVDFTDLAREGAIGFLIGHTDEYELLAETLGRPTNPNALLVGEAGIGKEAIVQHLAFRLSKDDVPRTLFDKRLVSLNLQDLIAGVTQEELSARLAKIVNEIYAAGNIILYIPDIQNLLKTSNAGGGAAYLSAADALMPVIKNNGFPIVGATDPASFKQFIEPRSDFTSAFEEIHVNEITEAEAEKILTYDTLMLEKESGVTISFGAIKRAVALSKKYFRNKFLPSSAEDLLKSTVAEAEHREEKTVGPDLVTAVAETKSNIPMHEASGAEAEKLLNMEETIHERMVGQEEAVKAIATALREYRSGLARKGGPIASFLFVGPTGVGKTELSKILAEIQFGSEKAMIRFDMTEYQDKESFVRLIGSAGGHGALTDAVLEKPYSLILLDEFEKAYPDILNLFLQVLDDGRLTDGLGRTVDFTNTIIIATSNAHSDIINEALARGESMSDIAENLRKRLVDVFKPELINRFSKIIIFKNLAPEDLAKIVTLNLRELVETAKAQGIVLNFDATAIAEIARLGYDPAFGARPLRRVIEEKIRAPLAEAILAKKIGKGSKVNTIYKDGEFKFE